MHVLIPDAWLSKKFVYNRVKCPMNIYKYFQLIQHEILQLIVHNLNPLIYIQLFPLNILQFINKYSPSRIFFS